MAGAIVDLASKHWVFDWRGNPSPNNQWWIVPYLRDTAPGVNGFFGIETSLNNGALFGMGQGLQWVFAALSVVALVGIIVWMFKLDGLHDGWLTVALGLICAGIIGNLVDRLGIDKLPGTLARDQYAVRDWILFKFGSFTWPNFNLADSYLVIGAVMLMGHAIFVDDNRDAEENADRARP